MNQLEYTNAKRSYLQLSKIYNSGGSKKQHKHKNTSKHKMTSYTKNLSDPWFSLVSIGAKTVEGRLNKGDFARMKVGDTVEWTNNDMFPRNVLTTITKINKYASFHAYLSQEGIDKCLPTVTDIDRGVSVYRKWFSQEDEDTHGVLAIHLKSR